MQMQKRDKAVKMQKTWTIFGVAGALLLAALIYGVALRPGSMGPITAPLPPTDPVAEGQSHATAGGTLTMTARLGHAKVLKGTTSSQTHLLVDVDAVREAAATEVPLDVAVVIDRSGSMTLGKLEAAQRAARALIDQLRPGDRATLVSYSTNVTIEVPLLEARSNTATFHAAIDGLLANGGTNISGGLETASRVLGDGSGEQGQRVRRIILLSDGQATAGMMEVEQLAALSGGIRHRGVSVTAMGLGLDFNERAMTRIAVEGGGSYHFIERSTELEQVFRREFANLQASVARDAKLVIELAEGVAAREVHGFAHTVEGRRVEVPLSEFFAGQNKSLLLELAVAPSAAPLVPVARVELSYRDLLSRTPARHELSLSVATTDDAAAVASSADREVFIRREQILTAQAYEDAMSRYESGDRDGARRVLQGRNVALRQAQERWGSQRLGTVAEEAEEASQALDRFDAASDEGRAAIKSNRARSNKMLLVK